MAEAAWHRHWAIIWRSELRAMAEDRELMEAPAQLAAWLDSASGRAGAAPQARPATAAVPPDDGGAAERIARLARRVDELEQRLARLDPAGDP